jgi:hypothetical protein
MKPVSKLIRKSAQAGRSHKTKEDFLRWLRERRSPKQLRQEETAQAARAISKALEVWADDGGAPG